MNHRNIRKSVLSIALGVCLASMAPTQSAHAANSDGSMLGTAAPGAVVTVRNEETGFTRTVTADDEGNYRFPFLPVGEYRVEAHRDGTLVGTPVDARVSLGNTTKVDLGSGAASLERIEVVGDAIAAVVDVTSTESATNVTREEYSRLPVDRTLTDVALLAPGLNRGDNDLGGISFGGSSVAENAVYVNGLNVTDFYNRIGFNSTPFAFYEEVQVKTGGYSVEFGRTTGGVINAVTRSGTNEFHAGAELVWEPNQWQSEAEDRFFNGDRYYVARFDDYDRTSLNVYGSGPIIEDRLHFFAMYEFRDFQPNNTSTAGTTYFQGDSDDGFYGAKVDWSITDRHLLSFLAFSDETETVRDVFVFNPTTGERGAQTNTQFVQSGGDNWSATYTGYLTDSLSVKAMYG
ncbi:MAG TPA: TonB-dependent receptor, partial [Candidatus Saccharimonadia bacterium]|nr:TonB-dependent receptor [Candidatus Saccharimonadia bacterium]